MQKIYLESQPILNKLLLKINNDDTPSQAYLLIGKTNNNLKKYSNILTKALVCPDKYVPNCEKCNICKRIDDGNYGEIKIITPQNGVIKKEAIIELRNEFQTNSIEGKRRIYIIEDVDRLNTSAANSLLKFLEEPDTDLVAIFTSNNLDAVIPTIISRCQIIKLNDDFNDKNKFINELVNLDDEQIQYVIDTFYKVETNINHVICNFNIDFLSEFKNRQELKEAMNTLLLIYKDALNYLTGNKTYYFSFDEKILKLFGRFTKDEIVKKISFLLKNIHKLDYNVNMVLYMDNLLIGIGELTNGKSNRS